jgi:hypothetical protein
VEKPRLISTFCFIPRGDKNTNEKKTDNRNSMTNNNYMYFSKAILVEGPKLNFPD